MGPGARVADESAAQGEDVVHRTGDVVGDAEGLRPREVNVHLGRSLGAGSELEGHPHAVDGLLLAGLLDLDRGWGQGDGAERRRLSETGAELPVGAALEQRPVHVAGAATHRGAGENVLADRVVEEAGWGENGNAPSLDLRRGNDALGAAEVVYMAVRVDQAGYRTLAAVFAVEGEGCRCGLDGDQGVDHDDPLLALDDVHVGEIEATQLVEARCQLEEAGDLVQLAEPPEAWVGGVGCFSFEEVVGAEVPGGATVPALHQRRVECRDKPAARLLEI